MLEEPTPLTLRHVAQDGVQDPTIPVVIHFHRRVDSTHGIKLHDRSIRFRGRHLNNRPRLHRVGDGDVERFRAVEAEGFGVDAFGEGEREDAHADQVASVDAFEAFGDDGFDVEEEGAFGGPVAAGAHAVVDAGEDDQGRLGLLVVLDGVVDVSHWRVAGAGLGGVGGDGRESGGAF